MCLFLYLIQEPSLCQGILSKWPRRTRTDFVTPCTRLCHTLYQTLSNLVLDLVTLSTRLCHTLYQTLSHVPEFVTDPAIPCTRPCQHLVQLHRERGVRPVLFAILSTIPPVTISLLEPGIIAHLWPDLFNFVEENMIANDLKVCVSGLKQQTEPLYL